MFTKISEFSQNLVKSLMYGEERRLFIMIVLSVVDLMKANIED